MIWSVNNGALPIVDHNFIRLTDIAGDEGAREF